jgi:hypothetical protein
MAVIDYLLKIYLGFNFDLLHPAMIFLIGWGLVSLYRSGHRMGAIILFAAVPLLDLGGVIVEAD